MPERSAESTCKLLSVALLLAWPALTRAGEGSIVKPPDGAWIPGGSVEVIALASDGRLFLDGQAIDVEEPFAGVLHARISVPEGRHVVRLDLPEGVEEVTFHAGRSVGKQRPSPYVSHPPVPTPCTHCHSVSRRGRFRFRGGCDTCHADEEFIRVHSHEPHELASCGMCHDAHGSDSDKLLLVDRNLACKQCHN